MAKKLAFELLGVRATAELFPDRAPRTVEAVWKALAQPIERDVYHSIWSGKEIFFYIPDTDRDVPLENHSTWCDPGELFWFYMPARALKVRGQTPELRSSREIFEIAIIYGQSNFRIMGEDGWRGNIFGEIRENKEAFLDTCGRVLDEGIQKIHVWRVED